MTQHENSPEKSAGPTGAGGNGTGTAVTGAGTAQDARTAAGEETQTLTTRQGHPVYDNQNTRTVGNRGPATLENYQLIEKISHFDRERIPERVVHARGAGAHGTFEAYGTVGEEPIEKYTRAKLFNTKGKETPVFVRFSSVIHGGHSPETLRDPRGFATKFYTEDGNWDLVGNNLKVFFIRDAMKFPDMVHSLKPDPVTNRQDGGRIFDFMSNTPESLHMLTFLFSPWGIPANYRQMQGSGVNTYKWVNQDGVGTLVKYHWEPQQGVKNLTQPEAEAIQAKNFNHATQDLYEAIAQGNFPRWELRVQLLSDDDHPELDFDPLDDTKLWPEDRFPHLPVGMMTLNRNPDNYFAEVEQVAFGTGVLVDGLDFSDDKMLQGRTFSYSDTQRYRVGPNYLQLPINAPKKHVATNQRDGQMTYHVDTAPSQNPHVNYEPSSLNGLTESPRAGADHEPKYRARLVRQKIDRRGDVDFTQPGERWRQHDETEKTDLINNLTDALSAATTEIQDRMVELFGKCDAEYGQRLRASLDQVAQDPSAATSRYMGGRVRPANSQQNGAHGQPGANAAVRQAEATAHDAKPY